MKHSDALHIAEKFLEGMRPHCDRIEIAGSIRRGKAEPGDIELIAVPVLKPPVPQFGDRLIFKTPLDKHLHTLLASRAIEYVKNGPKFKQFWAMASGIHLIKVDLFLVTPPAQWGPLLMIRTGPDEFSKWMVTQQAKGGPLPNGYYVKHGAVWAGYEKEEVPDLECRVDMPEEADYFSFCGLEWIAPSKREAQWGKAPTAVADS